MASKAHREMAAAVGFAEVFSKQVKDYYQKEKPRAKRVIPIINRVIEAAEEQVLYFRQELTIKDVLDYIGGKVDRFNAATKNGGDMKESALFIIGMITERICELQEHNSKSGHIERLEAVLAPMNELYDYFEDVKKEDVEDASIEFFKAWEAA